MMKNYVKTFLTAALVALLAVSVSAAPVDADAARALASGFLSSRPGGRLAAAPSGLQLAHVEPSAPGAGDVDYYVFNTADGGAFVLVAGDDRAEQILGYGNGSLDVEKLPENVRWWLGEYKRQIAYLRSLTEGQVAAMPRRSPADDVEIEPLLTCRWSQMEPYYDQCPVTDDQRCVTGCVATAMAQVMYYWKYPAELPALPGYRFCYFLLYDFDVDPLPGAVLDWDNMCDTYGNNYTPEQGTAVATLMRYCGQGCFMSYSPEGSSSTGFSQLAAFKRFGYNQWARQLHRNDFDDDRWRSLIIGELQAGHPIPYTGRSDNGGHAFVLDGYCDGRFHVNWGWAGVSDGYFALDAFMASGYDFRFDQDMNYHVFPDDGSVVEGEPAYDFEVDGIYYLKNGDEAIVTYRDDRFDSYSGVVEVPEQVEWDGVTYPVTAVGDNAFACCPSLTALRLPFIKRIGNQTIDGSTALTEWRLGKSLETLGSVEYYSCPQLRWIDADDLDAFVSLDFSYGSPMSYGLGLHHEGKPVTHLVVHRKAGKIGQYVLSCLQSLEHVTIEDGVKSIGNYAFYGCDNLKTVTIGDSLESLGIVAFYGCDNLESVVFGEHAGSIGSSSFYGCSNINHLVLPQEVDTICYAAFAYCDKIPALSIHNASLLDDYAFYGCHGMKDLTFSGKVQAIGGGVFSDCTGLTRVDVHDLSAWCNTRFIYGGGNPLNVAHHLYRDGELIQDLVIPDDVDSVSAYAFEGASGLTSVTVPTTVSHIGSSAFLRCSGLTAVRIPDMSAWCGIRFDDDAANPLSSAHHLLLGGEEVIDLDIPDGVSSIAAHAFTGGSSFTGVSIPASVSAIGMAAFRGCSALTDVRIADLGSWCGIRFADVSSNPLTMVPQFHVGDEAVTRLVVPDGVEAVSDYAFYNCDALTAVTLGDDVKSVGSSAFYDCNNLAELTLGNQVEHIGESAFYMCTALEDVSLGDQVKSIGEKAFGACTGLKHLTLGKCLETIGAKAFTSCMVIGDITCRAITPPVLENKNAFAGGIYKKAMLTVPQSALDAYKSAGVWDQFVNITGAVMDHALGDVNLDGEVTVADVDATFAQMLDHSLGLPADVNGDGEVNIADVNAIIDLIMCGQ